jgi:hypothetical protein
MVSSRPEDYSDAKAFATEVTTNINQHHGKCSMQNRSPATAKKLLHQQRQPVTIRGGS